MPPKLVIFDCDGVLVDSEDIANDVIVRSLANYGLRLTFEECMDLFVGTTDNYVKITAEKMGARLPQDWLAEIDTETFARLKQEVKTVAGVEDVLERLEKMNIPFCVASNGTEEKMAITLGKTGLLKKFQNAMYSAPSLSTAKPNPDLFLHAARTFNIAPASCVVIEDSPSGAKAARRAKMKCFGYTAHNSGQKLVQEGAEIFHDMNKLIGLLGL